MHAGEAIADSGRCHNLRSQGLAVPVCSDRLPEPTQAQLDRLSQGAKNAKALAPPT